MAEQQLGTTPSGTNDTATVGWVQTGTATFTNKTFTSPTINSATENTPTVTGYTETVNALGVVSSSHTIPALSGGTVITATLTASTACTFTMPTATAGQSFILLLKQAASTGNGTATFTGVKWPANTSPVQTATAATMDAYTFFSDGTDWYGAYSQAYIP